MFRLCCIEATWFEITILFFPVFISSNTKTKSWLYKYFKEIQLQILKCNIPIMEIIEKTKYTKIIDNCGILKATK